MPNKKTPGKVVGKSVPVKGAAPKRVQQRTAAKAAASGKLRSKAAAPKSAKPAKPTAKATKKPAPAPVAAKTAGVHANKPGKALPEAGSASKQPVAHKQPMAKMPAHKAAPAGTAAPMQKAPVGNPAMAAARPAAPVRAMPAAVSKPGAPKLTAPLTPKQLAEKAAAARQQQLAAASAQASKKPVSQRHGFKTNEFIVYPAHGVGRIIGIEEQEIAGITLELFVIQFEKDKMTLRVPTGKSQSVGMRKLAEENTVKKAMETLKGKARIKRTMWSRRAQEYEAKINSGDLIAIAEVVRDLYRSETQPEQSYSERQLYEAALDRMAREIAAVDKLDERGAMQRITEVLSKSAKGRRVAEEANPAEIKAA
jgi:CarD family transcriptional regulator